MAGLFDEKGLFARINQGALPFAQNNQAALAGAGLELLGGGGYSGAARAFLQGAQADSARAGSAAQAELAKQRFDMEKQRLGMARQKHQQDLSAGERVMAQQNKTQQFIASKYPDLVGLPPDVQNKVLGSRLGGGGGASFGKTPVFGIGPDDQPVMGQLSDTGDFKQTELPEGFRLTPGVQKVDLGTHWGVMDRGGNVTTTIPKDIRGAESEKVIGKSQGETEAGRTQAASNAKATLGVIDKALAHEGRTGVTGGSGMFNAPFGITRPGSQSADYMAIQKQLEGKAFMEAFQSLKGGGQITETEGRKATQAIGRLETSQSDEAYEDALNDLRAIAKAALDRSEGRQVPDQADDSNVDSLIERYGGM